jgi:DNA replication protein DnaC
MLEMRRHLGMKQNEAGTWLCVCGAELQADDDLSCAACRTRMFERNERRARDEWSASIRDFAPLGGVPAWPWARCENPQFMGRLRSKELTAFAGAYHPRQGSVLLAGKTGAGKTSGVVAMLHRVREAEIAKLLKGPIDSPPSPLLRALRGLLWTDGFALTKARRENPLGRGEAELVEQAMSRRLLVLDELGFEAAHDTVIAEVMNARYVAGLPVIITTGLTRAQFSDRYGDAVLRRIIERGTLLEAWT